MLLFPQKKAAQIKRKNAMDEKETPTRTFAKF